MPHIILDGRVEKSVGHWAARADSVQEQIEAVPAGAKLDFGMRVDHIIVDRLHHRPLDHIGRARDEHDQFADAADGLIGIADPIVDMNRAGRGDQANEQAYAHQDLEAEGD